MEAQRAFLQCVLIFFYTRCHSAGSFFDSQADEEHESNALAVVFFRRLGSFFFESPLSLLLALLWFELLDAPLSLPWVDWLLGLMRLDFSLDVPNNWWRSAVISSFWWAMIALSSRTSFCSCAICLSLKSISVDMGQIINTQPDYVNWLNHIFFQDVV